MQAEFLTERRAQLYEVSLQMLPFINHTARIIADGDGYGVALAPAIKTALRGHKLRYPKSLAAALIVDGIWLVDEIAHVFKDQRRESPGARWCYYYENLQNSPLISMFHFEPSITDLVRGRVIARCAQALVTSATSNPQEQAEFTHAINEIVDGNGYAPESMMTKSFPHSPKECMQTALFLLNVYCHPPVKMTKASSMKNIAEKSLAALRLILIYSAKNNTQRKLAAEAVWHDVFHEASGL